MDAGSVAAIGALAAALATIATVLVRTIRRGELLPKIVWERAERRADLADTRADKLVSAIEAQNRAIADLTAAVNRLSHDGYSAPPPSAPTTRVKRG